jgi:hypothetical protein
MPAILDVIIHHSGLPALLREHAILPNIARFANLG